MKLKLLTLFIIFYFVNTSAQRTLYVDDFHTILGSSGKENQLLGFANRNNISTLILYQLNKIDKIHSLSDPRRNNILAEFIAKAKNVYGINKIGASGESASFFEDRIQLYNNSRSKSSEKFDVYNLEFEYWSKKASSDQGYYCENYLKANKKPCNRKGSFNYFVDNLKQLRNLSKNSEHPIKIDCYVGYFLMYEIREISKHVDEIILHTAGKSPKYCIISAKKSLEKLALLKKKVKTSIYISSRMNQMGYWLKANTVENSERDFYNEMNLVNKSYKKKINFIGFSYNPYSYLDKAISYYWYSRN